MKQQRVNYTCPDCGRSYRDVVVPLKCRCKFKRRPDPALCIHRGIMLETITCRGCGGEKQVDVYECGVHDRCHTVPANDHRAGMSCTACAMADEGFQSREKISPES